MAKRTRWIVGLSLTALVLFGQGLYQWIRLSSEQRRLDRQLAELAAEHGRLLQEQTRLQSDPAYVEGLIRSTFKLAKPGEYVIPLNAPHSSAVRRQQ